MKNPFISKKYKIIVQYLMYPKMALWLLENYNRCNPRPVDWKEVIKRLARSITKGEWRSTTAQPLAFLQDGQIGNGQHRLAAIVESGIPVRVDIACGLTREDVALMDTHRTRSVAVSWAWVLGGDQAAIAKLKVAVPMTRMWMRFVCNWAEMRFTRKEGLDFYLTHFQAIQLFMGKVENRDANRSGFRAACAVYSTINKRKAIQLFEAVSGNGEKLREGSIEKLLRDYLSDLRKHPEKQLITDFTATLDCCFAIEHGEKRQTISHKMEWK